MSEQMTIFENGNHQGFPHKIKSFPRCKLAEALVKTEVLYMQKRSKFHPQ